MSPKTVYIKSFGCQMNKLDTALVTAALKNEGYEFTDNSEEADVVLINTCSVRQRAEEKVFSRLGDLKHLKQSKPDIIVGVIGCMAQRLGDKLLQHQAVNIVCGSAQIPKIIELIKLSVNGDHKLKAITENIRKAPPENQYLEEFESVYDTADQKLPGQAFVRVMRGCDNFCSYCVVPFVRGPEISRPPKLIIDQIKRLAGHGVKLITLLGQTVNSYKYTGGEKTYCLADLLYMASDIEPIEWIRFVTNYPSEQFSDEIFRAMADLPKVANYLHMPAQSGSDKILKAMNRNYTAKQYMSLLEKARHIVPNITITSDFIVGFPDETQQDYQATVDLVKEAKYKNCFIFKYSPRPNTTADKQLHDTIPLAIKKQRNNQLLKVQEEISDELSSNFLDKEVTVFVEGLSKKPHLDINHKQNLPQLTGRTADDWIVVFNDKPSLAGSFARVRIIRTSPLTLFGKLT